MLGNDWFSSIGRFMLQIGIGQEIDEEFTAKTAEIDKKEGA